MAWWETYREDIQLISKLKNEAEALILDNRRTQTMTKSLIRALRLFNENYLGDVCRGDFVDRDSRLRKEFFTRTYGKSDHGYVGVAELGFSRTMLEEFLFNRFIPNKLRDIVRIHYYPLCRILGRDKFLAHQLKKKFEPAGLYFGMTEEDIVEAFGQE